MVYLLSVFVLLVSTVTSGGCLNVIPGENLWRLTASIGSCLDLVGSSLDQLGSSLDQLGCAVGKVIELNQANLSAGMTITIPGHYKLCENVTAPSPAAVLINSDDVIFDLGGFVMDNMKIFIGDGVAVNNVVVQNGTMINGPQNFIDIFPSGSQNITLQNLILDTVTTPTLTNFAIRAETTSGETLVGLAIRNVTIYNGTPNNIILAGTASTGLIREVILDGIQLIGTNSAFTVNAGVDNALFIGNCEHVFVNNVSVENPGAGINGIWIDNSSDVFVTNSSVRSDQSISGTPIGFKISNSSMVTLDPCVCDGAAFNHGLFFDISNQPNCIFNNCYVNGSTDSGFVINNTATLDNCSSSTSGNNGFELTSCIATNIIANVNDASGIVLNGIITGCTVTNAVANNNSDGFVLNGSNHNVTNATATFNANNGFTVNSINSVLTNTSAAQNINFGYSITSALNSIINSTATNNAVDGFNFNSAGFINSCIGCESMGNGGAGYTIAAGVISKNMFQQCIGSGNTTYGFITDTLSDDNTFDRCSANNNLIDGFHIISNGNSCIECTSNNNGAEGFYISVTDGFAAAMSTANFNADCGFLIDGIMAEAIFNFGLPQDHTWSIGFDKTLPTTTDRNVRLTDNTALRNENTDYLMRGSVVDINDTTMSLTFSDSIYPTIGVQNQINGAVVPNNRPVLDTVASNLTSANTCFVNVVGGNMCGTSICP